MEYLMISKTTTRKIQILHKDILYDVVIDYDVSEEEVSLNVWEQLWKTSHKQRNQKSNNNIKMEETEKTINY